MALIAEEPISAFSVYGVRQVQYSVDAVPGQDFVAALTAAAFRQATAVEAAAASFADVVRLRQRKLDDLGFVLAVLAKAIASMTTNNPVGSDKSDGDADLPTAASLATSYNITMELTGGNMITRQDALDAQNDIRYALDLEDNNLQQDTVSLQSLLTKRDNSFSNAAKIVKKALNASGAAMGNIGE